MLSKVCFFFLLSVMVSSTTFAGNRHLVFRSLFEERIILQAIQRHNPDLVTLFSVINTDSADAVQYNARLNKFYTSLDSKVNATKSNKQKAKVIFKEVHDYFLNQYEEHTSFNNIFENGRYNCVTACMLYSMVLKRYGVPYAIKEKPTMYILWHSRAARMFHMRPQIRRVFSSSMKNKRKPTLTGSLQLSLLPRNMFPMWVYRKLSTSFIITMITSMRSS